MQQLLLLEKHAAFGRSRCCSAPGRPSSAADNPPHPTPPTHLPRWAEGNLHGILVGREVLPDGILYASRETHYSVFKAGRMYRMDAVKVGGTSQPGGAARGVGRRMRQRARAPPVLGAAWQPRMGDGSGSEGQCAAESFEHGTVSRSLQGGGGGGLVRPGSSAAPGAAT